MLKLITLTLLLLFSVISYSQTRLPGASSGGQESEGSAVDFNSERQLKEDIADLGLTVANNVMKCCSTWGGKNIYSKVDYPNVRHNSTTGAFTVPMTIGWYGSLSGTHYWIQGKLVIYSTGRKDWLKINDSGGFNPGCSKDCIY